MEGGKKTWVGLGARWCSCPCQTLLANSRSPERRGCVSLKALKPHTHTQDQLSLFFSILSSHYLFFSTCLTFSIIFYYWSTYFRFLFIFPPLSPCPFFSYPSVTSLFTCHIYPLLCQLSPPFASSILSTFFFLHLSVLSPLSCSTLKKFNLMRAKQFRDVRNDTLGGMLS